MQIVKRHRNTILLHFVVVLLGFTAILGKAIDLSSVSIVWYRMLIATAGIGLYMLIIKGDLKLSLKSIICLSGIGVLVALHWALFFEAIKVSNVSVTLGCFATVTFFTSLLEPLVHKKRILWLEVVVGVLVIIGLYTIFQFETNYLEGIVLGISAAFVAALFTVLNKKMLQYNDEKTISFYEMLSGFLAISIYFYFAGSDLQFSLPADDILYLLILGLVCTAFAFVAAIEIMKELSAYTVVLTINLEPVYGILLAYLIFGESEKMTAGFYVGGGIILLAVLLYPMAKRYLVRKK